MVDIKGAPAETFATSNELFSSRKAVVKRGGDVTTDMKSRRETMEPPVAQLDRAMAYGNKLDTKTPEKPGFLHFRTV